MNDWSTKSYNNGSHNPRKLLPATAAVDQLSQSMKDTHTVRINGSHRGSLDSAMKMHLKKRFDTTDLFSALVGGASNDEEDQTAFPEIKWCTAEESQNNVQRITSSSTGQLHQPPQPLQQQGASTAGHHSLGGGMLKTQSWPVR